MSNKAIDTNRESGFIQLIFMAVVAVLLLGGSAGVGYGTATYARTGSPFTPPPALTNLRSEDSSIRLLDNIRNLFSIITDKTMQPDVEEDYDPAMDEFCGTISIATSIYLIQESNGELTADDTYNECMKYYGGSNVIVADPNNPSTGFEPADFDEEFSTKGFKINIIDPDDSDPLTEDELKAYAFADRLVRFYSAHRPAGDKELAELEKILLTSLKAVYARDDDTLIQGKQRMSQIISVLEEEDRRIVEELGPAELSKNPKEVIARSLCTTFVQMGGVDPVCVATRLTPAYLAKITNSFIKDYMHSRRLTSGSEYVFPAIYIATAIAGADQEIIDEQLNHIFSMEKYGYETGSLNLELFWQEVNLAMDFIEGKR